MRPPTQNAASSVEYVKDNVLTAEEVASLIAEGDAARAAAATTESATAELSSQTEPGNADDAGNSDAPTNDTAAAAPSAATTVDNVVDAVAAANIDSKESAETE